MASRLRVALPGLLLLVSFSTSGAALAEEDPDTEAARRHFKQAMERYDARDYAGALGEFQTARELKPAPQFDYNIGRCYDRMERYEEAADAYRRFLAASPEDEDAPSVRARIEQLEKRLESRKAIVTPPTDPTPRPVVVAPAPPPAKPTSTPLYQRGWLWGVVGAVVVAALAVGLGVGLSGSSDMPPSSIGGNFPVMWR